MNKQTIFSKGASRRVSESLELGIRWVYWLDLEMWVAIRGASKTRLVATSILDLGSESGRTTHCPYAPDWRPAVHWID